MACGSHSQYSASRSARWGAGGMGSEGFVPRHPLQAEPLQPWLPWPPPSRPLPTPWPGRLRPSSHLGFVLHAASRASRWSAFSATRALRRLSVRGCSLRAGRGVWGSRSHRLATACQPCPGGSTPHPSPPHRPPLAPGLPLTEMPVLGPRAKKSWATRCWSRREDPPEPLEGAALRCCLASRTTRIDS